MEKQDQNKENEPGLDNKVDPDEFLAEIKKINAQRDVHINKRDAISKTIEKKQRELDFLKNLTPNEVIYMKTKKNHYAAKMI